MVVFNHDNDIIKDNYQIMIFNVLTYLRHNILIVFVSKSLLSLNICFVM